jgi:arylformamidase
MTKIIDLSHQLNNHISVYPGTANPLFKQVFNIKEHGFAETKINMLSHHGTHMDAPAHMILNGKTLDQFEPEKFFGKACCINCSNIQNSNIDLNLLKKYEHIIKTADFVLFFTSWSNKWGTEDYYSNFPVLSKEACQWLSNFNLKGIGLDNISLDKIDTENFENHYIILGKGMIIIENLTNLDLLENKEFTLSCFPLKFDNADGSPVRAVAFV